MNTQTLRALAVGATLASGVFAQNSQRPATMVGGGSQERGKCTVEVVVDSAAQVEIRGATATLRTLSGQPAQWRRFECTAAMPSNPPNFRFSGVDGRGSQQLVRSPDNGGVAVVQIEDKDGGAEGYTFDITWGSGGSNQETRGPVNQPMYQDRNQRPPVNQPTYQDQRGSANQPTYQDRNQGAGNAYPGAGRNRSDEQYRPNYRDSEYYKRYGHAFGVDEAIRTCQQAVLRQASQRFRTTDVHFHRTAIDDAPGRQDWVTGTLDVHRGQREERFGFSCSVNFDNGRVRSADVDPRPLADDPRWH
jgi:hypothetical protein